MRESLIFEQSRPGRYATVQAPAERASIEDLPERFRRRSPPCLPEVSELQAVRHFTRLSQENFSVDTQFYPLGSCTMKYNPKACDTLARLPGFLGRHPYAPDAHGQGVLGCLFELQEMLKAVTGMPAVSLAPMAGAQGELCGMLMIRAYHAARGELAQRTEVLVPDAAHGTNPATATMCGFKVVELATAADGDVDLGLLERKVGPNTAGIMLTNPSTLGLFERRIVEIAEIVHRAGGLLYYDGANLNAILGKVLPADMGFNVMHVNLHKTFSTPHGGGGPGAGPVGAAARLEPYLPVPLVGRDGEAYRWIGETERPSTIGRLSTFTGNIGVLLRAYVYLRMVGADALPAVAEYATLNANYLAKRLADAGFELAFPHRRSAHEFVITLRRLAREHGVRAGDVAKALLDYGCHAPTAYFPLLVPECLLIEPTETEPREVLDAFVAAMADILRRARENPEDVKGAPYSLPLRRLDEVRAAKHLDLRWTPPGASASS